MPLDIAKTWIADEDFLADDINANFTNIKNKFSETNGVGIGDGDIANDADISGLKLSNADGKQIPEDRIKDDAVTADKLRDDPAVNANRAVTTDHVRDEAITKAKVKLGDLTKAQTAIVAVPVTIPATAAVAGKWASAQLVVTNNAGNVRVVLSGVWTVFSAGIYSNAQQDVNLDPAVAIPFATNTVLGVYFSALTLAANISGTIVIVYVPNT